MKHAERRKWLRKEVPEPELSIIYCQIGDERGSSHPPNTHYPLFVGVHNISQEGLSVELTRDFDLGTKLVIFRYDCAQKEWCKQIANVTWSIRVSDQEEYMIGLELLSPTDPAHNLSDSALAPPESLFEDIDFLLNTKILKSIPKGSVWPLLNCLTFESQSAGSRLITQGEEGDALYIIQKGTCIVKVKKDDGYRVLDHMSDGEVAGEMAVLTGEPRYADVIAETDMKLWKLSKQKFDELSARNPDLRMFLTDLISSRLESAGFTADRTIGKYLIRHKLGQGAWSIVYYGIHQSLNMPVAVKMLKHRMAMDEDFLERFNYEAKIIAQMNHMNIVHIFDIEDLYKTLFIVMEYLEGESLAALLKRLGALPSSQALDYLMQICAGLAYAHDKGIIHQDIKPANIHILPNGQIKILDFGLACPTGSEELCLEGTLFYMAPEQMEGETVDARTDIYCLGITVFEMVSGQRPYPEDNLADLMDMRLEQDIPDPAGLVPGLPEELRSFIITACHRDPDKRFQSVEKALKHLHPLYRKMTGEAKEVSLRDRRMTSLYLFFQEEHRSELNRLLEKFSAEAQQYGISVKIAAEFIDF